MMDMFGVLHSDFAQRARARTHTHTHTHTCTHRERRLEADDWTVISVPGMNLTMQRLNVSALICHATRLIFLSKSLISPPKKELFTLRSTLKSKSSIYTQSLIFGWSNILLCFQTVRNECISAQTFSATVLGAGCFCCARL